MWYHGGNVFKVSAHYLKDIFYVVNLSTVAKIYIKCSLLCKRFKLHNLDLVWTIRRFEAVVCVSVCLSVCGILAPKRID